MAKPYSEDLRRRVVAAALQGGVSGTKAAARFGVAISTANGWIKRYRATGSVAPGQISGHKPAALSGAHRDWLLERCTRGDFTLRGLVAELVAKRGLQVDYVSVWRFVHAHGLTHKERPSRPASATAPTYPGAGRNGYATRGGSIPSAWSSSMKPGPRRTWRRSGAGRLRDSACPAGCLMVTGTP